ncbi:hypothetical protein C8F04DRAFT_1242762 [Mycena alexandri]|uniref:C2 domain-containing protein n=1 Tax=Mycena alexandri TaxID=1745969 RepID=A0AAD6WPR3_9AGAR|nr:hypothetical protein C8F04DRAFT_1242762 [Mycena alexandri]
MAQNYSLLIKSADNIVWDSGHLRRNPKVYVTVSLDDILVSQTPVSKRSLQPKWNSNLNLLCPLTSVLTFKLYHSTFIPHRPDPFLGKCKTAIQELLHQCDLGQAVQLDVATSGTVCGRLTVLLERSKDAATHATERMQKTAEILSPGGSGFGTVDATVEVAATHNELATALSTCINHLNIFVKMGDKIAQVEETFVWVTILSILQAVKQQYEMDNNVVGLVKTMVEVYSFEEDIHFVPEKIKILEESLLKISQHTLECANFLEEYKQHGFAVHQGGLFRPHF